MMRLGIALKPVALAAIEEPQHKLHKYEVGYNENDKEYIEERRQQDECEYFP